jgi:hypothetical protein
MPTFKFIKTVQYTEIVEVEAETLAEAKEKALEADGERNHDDTLVSMEPARK